MELEECIKDALEDSMQAYIHTDKYQEQKQKVDCFVEDFRNSLSEDQITKFNVVLDAISEQNSMFASEAYMHGVVEGIALHGKVIGEQEKDEPALISL